MNTRATQETTDAATGAQPETEPVAAEVELTEEQAFDAAFEEATVSLSDDDNSGGDNGTVTSREESDSDDAGDGEAGDDAGGDGDSGDSTDDTSGDTETPATTTDDEGGAPDAQTTADTPTARELALQAQIDELKAAALGTKPVVEPEPEPETPQPILTDDEAAKVKAYREEWGDVSEAEALIRKEENQVIVGYIFDQVKAVIAPLLEAHESRNGRDQYTDLVNLVPDYDTVRDKAVDWVDKMPEGINKKIYTEVTKTGTPEEVAEMINAFKKATGYESSTASTAPAKAAPESSEPEVQKSTGSGAAAKPKGKAVSALKAVKTVRSKTNTGGVDLNDFDTAFDEFAQKK